jgi:anti-sigma factor RsiW
MKCLIETRESVDLLLAYGAGKLDSENTALLERHIGICPACREFANGQRALWEALDTWEAAPVTPDFDRRLYQRIEKEVSWWSLLMRPFRPMPAGAPGGLSHSAFRQGLPVAAAAFVVVMAGALLQPPALRNQPVKPQPAPQTESVQIEQVQPEQVEHALEAMQMLSDFSHQARPAGNDSQM